ncbi:iron complex transport system permease protein [Pseudovibrio denitrificans]|uniref:Iron complex transport system permease protein n=1 Tax=Pseudovibrio denitrificans TaxID=258256 RepID=A0A1I7DTZ1_9HYPH|nr:iron chelate uptake ABC transporter family permease subunit [Pseudovibrio denitrificans]SFU15125.1 iron complex transport system permease protein [Pseudovibrio denitrificans]
MKLLGHHLVVPLPGGALLMRKRSAAVGCVLLAFTLIAMFAAHWLGVYPIAADRILPLMFSGESNVDQLILLDVRMPRILVGVFVGGLMGMSGAIFQALMRNPLASPDVLGFNAGAAFGALLTIFLFGSAAYVFWGAVVGGVMTAVLVVALSWQRGLDLFRLIMVGIGIGFTLLACADFLMSQLDIQRASDMAKWLVGSLGQIQREDIAPVAIAFVVLGSLGIVLQYSLDRLAFDEDLATGLGLKVNSLRLLLVAVAVVMTATAVAVAGPIPFVAFVSGPIARQLSKTPSSALILAAGIGILVTLLSDTAARTLVASFQMPTGVFTALIGAPYLIWLLARQAKRNLI